MVGITDGQTVGLNVRRSSRIVRRQFLDAMDRAEVNVLRERTGGSLPCAAPDCGLEVTVAQSLS
jgi:hypothetical protein